MLLFGVIEEMLCWIVLVKNMCWVLIVDIEFYGMVLCVGEKMMLFFELVNFDEVVFCELEKFDV